MKAPHEMSELERWSLQAHQLETALYLAQMHEDLAASYQRIGRLDMVAVHVTTGAGWRKEYERLKRH